jgi:hypothetical protein
MLEARRSFVPRTTPGMRVSRDSTAIASRHISIPGMNEPSELREPAFAWRLVVAIAAALVLLLLAVAGRYGYHRDEDGARYGSHPNPGDRYPSCGRRCGVIG